MNRSLSKILKKKLEDEDQEEVKIPTKKLKSRPVVSSIPVDGTHILNNSNLNRLKSEFFKQDCLSLSKSLLGKYLIRSINSGSENSCIIGKIVECEAYLGGDDKASHSYNGKKTERSEAMYMQAGTLYVYNIYGMYCCLNISSKGDGAAVLIRALEPVYGIEYMKANREKAKNDIKNLTNGPSKMCMAFKITKNDFNKCDLNTSQLIWLQESIGAPKEDFKIIKAKRIGIDYAGEEAVNKLYRFYIKDNRFVSVKSKIEIEENNTI